MESKFLLTALEEEQQNLIVYMKEVHANTYSMRYIDGIYLCCNQKKYLLCQVEKQDEYLVGRIKKQDIQEIAAFHGEESLTLKVKLNFFKHELLFNIVYDKHSMCWQWQEYGFYMVSNDQGLLILSETNPKLLSAMSVYAHYEVENECTGKIVLNSPYLVADENEVLLKERCTKGIEDLTYKLVLRDRNNKQSIEFEDCEIDQHSNKMKFRISTNLLKQILAGIEVWNVYLVVCKDESRLETRLKSNNNDIYPSLLVGEEGLFEMRAYTTQDGHLGMIIRNGEPLGTIKEVTFTEQLITLSGEIELLTYHMPIKIEAVKLKHATGYELMEIEEYVQEVADTINRFTFTIDTKQMAKASQYTEGDYYIELTTKIYDICYAYKLQFNRDQLIKEGSIFYPSLTITEGHYPLVITPMYQKSYFMIRVDNQFHIEFNHAKLKGQVLELTCTHNLDMDLKDMQSELSLESEGNAKITLLEGQAITDNQFSYHIPIYLLQEMNAGSMYKLRAKLSNGLFEMNKDIVLLDQDILESKRQVFANIRLLLADGTLLLGYKNKERFVLRKESIFTNGKVSKVKYKIAEKLAKVTATLRKEQVWLVGENLAQIAQDNGFAFFEYCMKSGKKEKIFYVSEKNNKNLDNLVPYRKNVLRYDSFKHMYYYHLARFLVVSHGIRDVMPRILHTQMKHNKKDVIYLQHGIIAMKKVFFNKDSYNGRIKRFIVTSLREKQTLIEEMNFKPEQVCVTGLARFDKLEDTSSKRVAKTILIMPTWREWINDGEDQFIASDFYKKYISLLNNNRLNQALAKHNIVLKFYPHIEMQKKYSHLFSHLSAQVKMVKLGEETVQDLIKECSMMVTDYSSVALDVNYLHKPTVYYHFDLDEYTYYRGSFIDLESELPGESFTDEEGLVEQILSYIETDFKYNENYEVQSNKFYTYHDQNNSERIYQEIKTVK